MEEFETTLAAVSAAPQKIADSTWVYQYEGIYWPVVLCGDEIPPERFMKSKTAFYVRPAILLGLHKYIWVTDRRLSKYDPGKDYLATPICSGIERVDETDPIKIQLDQARRQAFTREATRLKDATFWRKHIEAKVAGKKAEQHAKRKRRRLVEDGADTICQEKPVLGRARKQSDSVHDDWDSATAQLPTPNPTPLRPKERARTTKGADDDDTENDNAATFDGPGAFSTSAKRRKQSRGANHRVTEETDDDVFASNLAQSNGDPAKESGSTGAFPKERLSAVHERNKNLVRANRPRDGTCTIFVGNRGDPFAVPTRALDRCQLLADLVQFDESLGTHINLYKHMAMTPDQFKPLEEFFHQQEFTPPLVNSEGRQWLDGIIMQEEKDEMAEMLAKIYHTASKVQLEPLQDLCFRKLKALYPLSPNKLLVVLLVIMRTDSATDAGKKIHGWVIDHVAESFLTLIEREGMTLARLLQESKDLRQGVSEKLTGPRAWILGADD